MTTTTTHPLQSQDSSGIDEATFQKIRCVFSVILFPAVGVIGTVSNFFAIVVLAKQGLTHSSNVSMFNMAIAEFLVSALVLCVYTDGLIGDFDSPAVRAFLKIRDEAIYPTRTITRGLSSLCAPVMAAERFVDIFFPFAAARIFTMRKTFFVHVCRWLFITFYFLPTNVVDRYEFEKREIPSSSLNGSWNVSATSVVYKLKNRDWYLYHTLLSTPIFLQATPYIITACFSICIGFRMRRAVTWRKKQQPAAENTSNRNSRRVTKIVLIIMALFIISQLPYNYLCTLCIMDPESCVSLRTRAHMVNRYWISFVGSVNYTTGFFVYVTFNQRFRDIFLRTFLGCFFSDTEAKS
ncbi:lysophosphatidic acid receptor 4-like [Aplysia californica]|uniref:Lysophosphatidic acid receptor 4-like n=1 Tax=Aplysia californica TaxID=6500 RepID=A0ABM0JZL8_APLCA|nr:lysophosphatidic acid receptor 4-like [Aplysia californica]